jgi:hypothetical protein
MVTDFFYISIIAILLVAVAIFYFSPVEFTIEEERD